MKREASEPIEELEKDARDCKEEQSQIKETTEKQETI